MGLLYHSHGCWLTIIAWAPLPAAFLGRSVTGALGGKGVETVPLLHFCTGVPASAGVAGATLPQNLHKHVRK